MIVPESLWARARTLRLRRHVRRYPRRIVTHRYGRHELRVLIADELAAGWYDHDWAEPPELSVFRGRSLKPGARVFDLGAHQAVVALMLQREVQPGGLVVAVELNDHNARVAEENAELNGATGLVVVNAAVADTPGVVRVDWDLNAAVRSRSGSSSAVPALTIDELAGRYGTPDLVYLDVEGYECHALRGAVATLAARPDWFVEVHANGPLMEAGGSVDEVLAFFAGYRLLAMLESDRDFRSAPDELPAERFFLAALS